MSHGVSFGSTEPMRAQQLQKVARVHRCIAWLRFRLLQAVDHLEDLLQGPRHGGATEGGYVVRLADHGRGPNSLHTLEDRLEGFFVV